MSNIFNTNFLNSSPEENSNFLNFSNFSNLENSIKKKIDFTDISEFDLYLDKKYNSNKKKNSNFDIIKKEEKHFLDHSPLIKKPRFSKNLKNGRKIKKLENLKNFECKKKKKKIKKKKEEIFEKNLNSIYTDSSDEEIMYNLEDEKFLSKISFINFENFELLKKNNINYENFNNDFEIDIFSLIDQRNLNSFKIGFYDCKNCNEVFKSNQSLAGHIYKKHT